jgi:hypothetical protein
MFVSVFLTKRGDEYIVTDGGWLFNNFYDACIDEGDKHFQKLLEYYKEHYFIKMTTGEGAQFYYRNTHKESLVPNIVYDLSNFISVIVSSSFINFGDEKEKDDISRFTNEAKNYLSAIVPKGNIKYNDSIHESIKSVKFSAVIDKGSGLVLINLVTGTNSTNFINSICKASTTFEIADESSASGIINKKISLINNYSAGYKEDRILRYLNFLETRHNTPPVLWSEKDKIKEFV